MTMTIPSQIEEINIVRINAFSIDISGKGIFIQFQYGYKNPAGDIVESDQGSIILDETKYTQLLNLTPPGNKTFKEWIRPLIYGQIANHLGIPVGDIDS